MKKVLATVFALATILIASCTVKNAQPVCEAENDSIASDTVVVEVVDTVVVDSVVAE